MEKPVDNLLDVLCTSSARARVLELFFVDPSRRHYLRQVQHETDQPVRAVQRELARLSMAGLLIRYKDGNRVYYALDRNHPSFGPLRALVISGLSVPARMQAELAEVPGVRMAFVRETPEGWTVLVVGDMVTKHRVVSALERVGVAVDTSIYESDEFLRMLNDKTSEVRRQVERSVEIMSRTEDLLWHRVKEIGIESQLELDGRSAR